MGADRGIHVVLNDKEYEGLQPLAVAKLFAKITEQEKPNLIILGKQVQVKIITNTMYSTCINNERTWSIDHGSWIMELKDFVFRVHHDLFGPRVDISMDWLSLYPLVKYNVFTSAFSFILCCQKK